MQNTAAQSKLRAMNNKRIDARSTDAYLTRQSRRVDALDVRQVCVCVRFILTCTVYISDENKYIKSIRLKGVIVVTVHFTHAEASHAHSSSRNENQW